MLGPLATSVFCIVAILGLMAFLTSALRADAIDREVARKLLHLGVGASALALPFLFEFAVNVFAILAVGIAILMLIRSNPKRYAVVAGPLVYIDRQSAGELWFLAGITLVYCFTQGAGVAYFGAILILTLADASAALIGTRFGQVHFTILGSRRSVEGSAAFFVVAWVCASTILALMTTIPVPLLAGVVVALASSATEALSPNGSDNFTVPLIAWLSLHALETTFS